VTIWIDLRDSWIPILNTLGRLRRWFHLSLSYQRKPSVGDSSGRWIWCRSSDCWLDAVEKQGWKLVDTCVSLLVFSPLWLQHFFWRIIWAHIGIRAISAECMTWEFLEFDQPMMWQVRFTLGSFCARCPGTYDNSSRSCLIIGFGSWPWMRMSEHPGVTQMRKRLRAIWHHRTSCCNMALIVSDYQRGTAILL
jgi:hypothetical protein